jgi:hypothetical protein
MRTPRLYCFFTAAFAFGLSSLAITPSAWAQAEDQAASRALFDEGRRFADSGKYDQACPKFEAARKLYISAGVLLNLGDCYEKIGRTASAWTTFGEAASVANRTKRTEDAAEARRRQSNVEPRLSRLSIRVVHEEPGLTVKRDTVDVPSAAWNEPIPVDPGAHEIRAEAVGYAPWTTSVVLSPQDQTATVDVPELRPVQGPQAAVIMAASGASKASFLEQPVAGRPGSGQRMAGLLTGGAGVVTITVGGILGLVAKSQYTTAEAEPGLARHSDSVSAANLGNAATVVAVVGGVVVAVGVTIWLTAPSAHAQLGSNGRELLVGGTF